MLCSGTSRRLCCHSSRSAERLCDSEIPRWNGLGEVPLDSADVGQSQIGRFRAVEARMPSGISKASISSEPDRCALFSDRDAAATYSPHPGDYVSRSGKHKHRSYVSAVQQFHGFYSYDATTEKEFVELRPVGSDMETPYDTRIDLPVVAPPHCKLEIDGRCVLAFSPVLYPGLKDDASGRVSVSAVFDKGGKVISAVSTRTNAPADLIASSIENVKTWRLQPSTHNYEWQVTFVYEIDQSLARSSSTFNLKLPEEITVKGRYADGDINK